MDMLVPPCGDFVVFLRHLSDSAAVTIFWNPEKVTRIDELIGEIGRGLSALGGGLQIGPGTLEGGTACALGEDGWTPVVPAVDALSPLPLLNPGSGQSGLPGKTFSN